VLSLNTKITGTKQIGLFHKLFTMLTKDLPAVFKILKKVFDQSNDPNKEIIDYDPFRLLIGTIISLRTKSVITASASNRLFAQAPTVQKMMHLKETEIAQLIYPAGFYEQKAVTIKNISKILVQQYNGKVPDTMDGLLQFKGVGRKTANFVLSTAFNKSAICVDIHVHRITNRWGYVTTATPDKTELALRKKLPDKYWIPINQLLVLYGQTVCKPVGPLCNICKVEKYCCKVGI
jgi:endonuclease III